MDKNDILTLFIDHDEPNYLRIKIDNNEERKNTIYRLKLLDMDDEPFEVPEIKYEATMEMRSNEFHKLCREMGGLATYVEIQCLIDKAIFTCKGEFADRKTTYRAGTEGANVGIRIDHIGQNKNKLKKKDAAPSPQIVQGIYELKNLVLFGKCGALCDNIEIFMKNNYPLIIRYTVGSLGRIMLVITPIDEETTRNNYSDEDDYYSDEEYKEIKKEVTKKEPVAKKEPVKKKIKA